MKVNLIVAHPSKRSFNHAIACTAAEEIRGLGHELKFHDLYAEHFDPVMPEQELDPNAVVPPLIEEHIEDLCSADIIVIVHPNWWNQAPAILRGWVDRVFRAGKAYRFVPDGKGGAKGEGLLKADFALIFNTANTPQQKLIELYGNDPLETYWKDTVFGFCGVKQVIRYVFSPVITSTYEIRTKWLTEVRNAVREVLTKK